MLATLRERLRSGDVFVPGSRKFADLESYLIPAAPSGRACGRSGPASSGLPPDPTQRLRERLAELEALLPPRHGAAGRTGGEVRLEDGELVLQALQAEELPDSVQDVGRANSGVDAGGRIDRYSGGSGRAGRAFRPCCARTPARASRGPGASVCRPAGRRVQRLVVRHGPQFRPGLPSPVVGRPPVSARTTPLRTATAQRGQPAARPVAGPALGRRAACLPPTGSGFPSSGAVRNAKALPRYFGYGQGVTFYTHTADHYAQYGSKVIPATERDATYVLDEILGNETDVGHRRARHRHARLHRPGLSVCLTCWACNTRPACATSATRSSAASGAATLTYPGLHFTGHVQPGYIEARLDDLLRVAGSFKLGYVTASLFISKLQAYPRQHSLTYVLAAEYGRLIKTNFILRYLLQPAPAAQNSRPTQQGRAAARAADVSLVRRRRADPAQAGRSPAGSRRAR
ncbi:MAG: Tn3 family transposase [Hymenobacter sp.]